VERDDRVEAVRKRPAEHVGRVAVDQPEEVVELPRAEEELLGAIASRVRVGF